MRDIFLFLVLAIGVYYDIKHRIMPNKLILPSISIALFLNVFTRRYDLVFGALIVYVICRVMYQYNLIGGGDLKGLVFIALLKGLDYFRFMMIFFIIFTIPMLIYYKLKKKEKEVLPLYVPIFLAVCTIGVILK